MSFQLNNQQRKYLKGLAHNRKPVITVGQNGLTPSLMEELQQTLAHHELIKIKLPAGDKAIRKEMLETICKQTDASLVTLIGRNGVIFLQAKKSRIALPA
ncbi:MAG: YhbY family RNA-binding protein [Arenicellales bacterium]